MLQAGVSGLHKQGWWVASGLTLTDSRGYSEVSVCPAGVYVSHSVSHSPALNSVLNIIITVKQISTHNTTYTGAKHSLILILAPFPPAFPIISMTRNLFPSGKNSRCGLFYFLHDDSDDYPKLCSILLNWSWQSVFYIIPLLCNLHLLDLFLSPLCELLSVV